MESLLPKRRRRTTIPPEHLEKLEELFEEEQWPSREVKAKLAEALGHNENFVNIWFQNKRARVKKEQEKRVKALLEQTKGFIPQPESKVACSKAHVETSRSIFGNSVKPSSGKLKNEGRQENVPSGVTSGNKTPRLFQTAEHAEHSVSEFDCAEKLKPDEVNNPVSTKCAIIIAEKVRPNFAGPLAFALCGLPTITSRQKLDFVGCENVAPS
jgi:hypothetical protein